MKRFYALFVGGALLLAGAVGVAMASGHGLASYKDNFEPITVMYVDNPDNPVTPEKVELGRKLYHDPRLSKSGLFSCNTCHNIATWGMSKLPVDIGHQWRLGPVNSGTVFNAAFYEAQFWDGRAADLEEQAKGPILAHEEMAMPSEELAVERIASIPEYVSRFKVSFPEDAEPLTYDNIANAIAAFERTLLTPGRWDRFLLGDNDSLSRAEHEGMKAFVDMGCARCHNGVALGGGFEKMGLVNNYPSESPSQGRYDVTGKQEDKNVFKMTTLRNIEHTYPYFHDGAVWELEEAVRIMARLQLGRQLNDAETKSIVTFLKALTGEIPEHALRLPVLPASTAATPRPDPS
ncbi:cytochrome-c peroxidase [Desulfurivibrio alkaliphilus]|uniref:Cytochrome-c peroxidase n=1 Tax=Desulfurivibrio alkaliphilus (strain DSM 19089 / UNIQEM U267 / AHT2) TaxID=589865 RepID=D6Z5W9_DESAT|nr:cytochrome-c peroxidase [Desulfurivibrio alkaliphilus]ADH84851.1 Cytochrome-c peroxidase [Desulfurivibrio alkaliphilus AHT 2]